MKGEMIVNGAENQENIIIHNAFENNLKNINLNIPINKFTCVTGPSGCGKSSLIFDTIYAESQRNFLESMSGNLFGQKLMDKPKVDLIENLKPALNISQNYYNVNPRSTIGTVTDVSYYLRTLYAFLYSREKKKNVDINFFSANNPASCCPKCKGIGEVYAISEEALIPDRNKTLSSGGIIYYKGEKSSLEHKLLTAICEHYGIDIDSKIKDLSNKELNILMYREEPIEFSLRFKSPSGKYRSKTIKSIGVIPELEKKLKDIDIPSTFLNISKYLIKVKCNECNGKKLRKEIINYQICKKSISDIEEMELTDILSWLNQMLLEYNTFEGYDQLFQLSKDIGNRIKKMNELNLGYLSLGRSIPSLSGGEVQRIRLANQLNCSLTGLLYILDEPCKGLHFKNINTIINTTKELVAKGNTVIAIEHNKSYISNADKIIEMGLEGGKSGGYIISENVDKKTFSYNIKIKEPRKYHNFIEIDEINFHNLKNISVNVPCGCITCITGVSGSGKSSLMSVLADSCEKKKAINCKSLTIPKTLKKVLRVNQQPIGKTPRSTVVSYLGIYDNIRELFANTKEAINQGFTSSYFSMNIAGGRCEECQGTGKVKIELQYLPDSYIKCPVCKGKRFNNEVLKIQYNGKNINDILDTPISDLIPVFEDEDNISQMLNCIEDIGLGYLSLGQISMTLSGGEAQRIKLAKVLGTKSTGTNIYLLDEPTSGLNERDIKRLENILNKLTNTGETIIIIEHNLEFIGNIADYIIDLGNVAGNKGGCQILQGKPADVIFNKESSWSDCSDL